MRKAKDFVPQLFWKILISSNPYLNVALIHTYTNAEKTVQNYVTLIIVDLNVSYIQLMLCLSKLYWLKSTAQWIGYSPVYSPSHLSLSSCKNFQIWTIQTELSWLRLKRFELGKKKSLLGIWNTAFQTQSDSRIIETTCSKSRAEHFKF